MRAGEPQMPVWTLAQRVAHALLAVAVLTCLATYQGGAWHLGLGYLALIVALWRTVRGVVGPWQERFDGFVRSPRAALAYLRAVLAQREQRHLNHNPLGGWMVLVLLACALLAGASGALYDTDLFWGDPAVYRVHQWSGWAFAGLVPLHVAGVLFTSWRQRENLIGAIATGRKRAPGPDDVA